jgi:L-threonylcarbamoyladenylate synthase
MSQLVSSSSSVGGANAKMLGSCEEQIQQAAQFLREGKLVAFPTETVYGLGANAFDENAVRSIFTAKGRPLTDPLIVHIPHLKAAKKLTNISEEEMTLFELLGSALWPGPITMIVKAVDVLPLCVTANTGFVGLRVPNHPLALRLLEVCQLPICAPSANRFGHVSPTKAMHVYKDLGVDRGVSAIISGDNDDSGAVGDGDCMHGIESTVVKIDAAAKELLVYRQGAVSQKRLEDLLETDENVAKLGGVHWKVRVVSRVVHMTANDPAPAAVTVGQEAPGQAVTHYAPDNAVCLMSNIVDFSDKTSVDTGGELVDWIMSLEDLTSTVVIDFGGQWQRLLERKPAIKLLALRDLSSSGSYAEAARNLFDTLRWAEMVPDVKTIMMAPVLHAMEILGHSDTVAEGAAAQTLRVIQEGASTSDADIKFGLYDRQFRATSGKLVRLWIQSS